MKGSTPWEVFTAAPHRMMFLAGALQLVLTLLFWAVELAGRYTGLLAPLALSLHTTHVHLFLMLYCIFPFFTFGFLMTTFPRWMNGQPLTRGAMSPPSSP